MAPVQNAALLPHNRLDSRGIGGAQEDVGQEQSSAKSSNPLWRCSVKQQHACLGAQLKYQASTAKCIACLQANSRFEPSWIMSLSGLDSCLSQAECKACIDEQMIYCLASRKVCFNSDKQCGVKHADYKHISQWSMLIKGSCREAKNVKGCDFLCSC